MSWVYLTYSPLDWVYTIVIQQQMEMVYTHGQALAGPKGTNKLYKDVAQRCRSLLLL